MESYGELGGIITTRVLVFCNSQKRENDTGKRVSDKKLH